MASDVSLSGSLTSAQKTQTQGIKLAEDFSQFLTLLTTQLQNQDPLSPMDSTEFTNQLVQFSQVEQSINTNQKLDMLVNLQLAGISSVALGYVGMNVMYRSADMHFDGQAPVTVKYGLSQAPVSAKINVYDDSGKLVFTDTVPKSVGTNEYVWDGSRTGGGKAEPGTYTVSIDAFDSNDKKIEVTTAVSGHVKGIESQDGVIYVLIGERAVPLGNIINATLPAQNPPPEGEAA